MSVALIELVEMTATLNVVVSTSSTTVMQTYWTAPFLIQLLKIIYFLSLASRSSKQADNVARKARSELLLWINLKNCTVVQFFLTVFLL